MVVQFIFHIIILIIWPVYPLASAQYSHSGKVIGQPAGCDSRCGGVDIPYPFGIGVNVNGTECYADKWFEIECINTSRKSPYLQIIGVEVTNINYLPGTVEIENPVFRWNCSKSYDHVIDLTGSPFVYSVEYNKFMAVGCNNIAFLNSNGSEVSGCVSICDENEKPVNHYSLQRDGCHGKNCCETSLPMYLSEYNATFQHLNGNVVKKPVKDQCKHALIASEEWFYHNYSRQIASLEQMDYVPAVLEWWVGIDLYNSTNITRLSDHAECFPANNSRFYRIRCKCSEGYDGNPYIAGGCTVSDWLGKWPVTDPTKTNHSARVIVGVFSSVGSIVLLLGLWWLFKVVRKKMVKKRKEKFFKKNGGLLLEQRLSSGEVNVDKTKLFSLKDLEKATDHFNKNRVLGKGGQGTVYKGMLVDGKIVAVKKFKVQGKVEEFINEFVILSQINHRNVVKLLGCCLEIEIPLLVYEFIPNGTLFEYLHEQNEDLPMTWDMRLRIAIEVAGALFYLHSAASQPIYHRDVKSTNILLDEKYRAKMADFGASRMISVEVTHLTTVVQGTFGYLDPEYFHTSQFTEKSDVYSFGVVLVELLTGQRPISSLRPEGAKSLSSYFVLCMAEDRLFDIIDERVTREGEKEHIITVANLANRCLELNGRRRPTMKEVTMELERIRGLGRKFDAQQNHEEIQLAGVEDYQPWAASSASNTGSTLNDRASTSEVMPMLIK